MKHYFTAQKETIFRNVEVLIYVFDVEKEGDDLKVSISIKNAFEHVIFRKIWRII